MVVWGSGYKNGAACATGDGGEASCAIKNSTTPPQVWAKWRARGATWPNDSAAVQVGDLGTSAGKICHILEKSIAGHPVLVVTNGLDKTWESTDFGKSWNAVP